MKFTTLIPTSRNDGRSISKKEMSGIIQKFWIFGGCSVSGPIQGHWIDPETGVHYADPFRIGENKSWPKTNTSKR